MALILGDNFSYQGAKPLDARLIYNTVADMKAVGDATMYDGCMAYCKEADKEYQWKSTNSADPTTGKWREFTSGGGGGTEYTAGDGIDITEDVISTKQSQEGDIDEIIDVYPTAGELVSIVNAFNRSDIYSTDEKMIGQWHDGKPLYQRVVVDNNTYTSTQAGVMVSLLNDNTINLIGGQVVVTDNSGYKCITPRQSMTSTGVLYSLVTSLWQSDSGLIYAFLASGSSSITVTKIVAIIQYTKTTDTAISIGETTEYSTDEKIVGTWIDGKPLYQKSFLIDDFSNPTHTGSFGSQYDITHNLPIDNCIDCFGIVKMSYDSGTSYVFRKISGFTLNAYATSESATLHAAVANGCSVTVISTGFEIAIGQAIRSLYGLAILLTMQYTKTTD